MMDLQDLFPFVRPAKTSPDTLRGWIAALLPVMDALPAPCLRPRDRQKLAGYGFMEGTLICFLLERALREAPELFPELPDEADQMADLGTRAGLWLVVYHVLEAAAERARDQYTMLRAERVGRALKLLRYYRGMNQVQPRGMKDERAERKRRLLMPAQWAVTAWQLRIRKLRLKKRHRRVF